MYCYSVIAGPNCIIRELLIWIDISMEHPQFIQSLAKLAGKNLSSDIISKLINIEDRFKNLKDRIQSWYSHHAKPVNYMPPGAREKVVNLVKTFLRLDKEIITLIDDIKLYDQDDKLWQSILEHIETEQTYMQRLFTTLLNQMA